MNWNPIYTLVKKIPRGRVMTYGQLAKALRLPGGARTAGRAMAASPSGQGVPWHRVVGAGGRLLIREPYASLQRKLLESEGLTLAEKRILDFRNYEWNPAQARKYKLAKKKKSR
jgi:methylated-DNA-protein-cysteine methyltransferase-like protein